MSCWCLVANEPHFVKVRMTHSSGRSVGSVLACLENASVQAACEVRLALGMSVSLGPDRVEGPMGACILLLPPVVPHVPPLI
jgi:hypothetical protein